MALGLVRETVEITFRILDLRQRLSIRLDALRRRDTYGRLLSFVIRLLLKNVVGTRTYVLVLAIRLRALSLAALRST